MIAFLAGMAWAVNVTVWCWMIVSLYRRRARRRNLAELRKLGARDVYTLHPGVKALINVDTGRFEGYLLPSGRVVQHRYWHCLEGVQSNEPREDAA